MIYGFGLNWSKLGYVKISCGAPSLLARVVWSLSNVDNCSPLSNVVSLEGNK